MKWSRSKSHLFPKDPEEESNMAAVCTTPWCGEKSKISQRKLSQWRTFFLILSDSSTICYLGFVFVNFLWRRLHTFWGFRSFTYGIMHLDSLSFALSQISYTVANLTKKNFKSSVAELNHVSSHINLQVLFFTPWSYWFHPNHLWTKTHQLKMSPLHSLFHWFCLNMSTVTFKSCIFLVQTQVCQCIMLIQKSLWIFSINIPLCEIFLEIYHDEIAFFIH